MCAGMFIIIILIINALLGKNGALKRRRDNEHVIIRKGNKCIVD